MKNKFLIPLVLIVALAAVFFFGGTGADIPEQSLDLNEEIQAPPPIDPESVVVTGTEYTCTLTVVCHEATDSLDMLDQNKRDIIPTDGIIFPTTTVTFYQGESVYNILQRELKKSAIHFEFSNTPLYESSYVEGIGNLYEGDMGDLSGWLYNVNGIFPNYGMSHYGLIDGDEVEIVYSLDLGNDVKGETK